MSPIIQYCLPEDRPKYFSINSRPNWMKVVPRTLTRQISDWKCLLDDGLDKNSSIQEAHGVKTKDA